jgi:hypothetical protein
MSAVPLEYKPTRGGSTDLQSAVTALDWECALADTRYLTHDLHRYSSKFIPQIALQAIELLTQPGEVVLDPMVGSGTTLVEAWRASRRGVGFDLNPLAALITRAKVQRIPPETLDDVVARLLRVVDRLVEQDDGRLSVQEQQMFDAASAAALNDPRRTDPWFVKWFQPRVLSDLLVLDAAIGQVADERARTLAVVALSENLRRSSNAHSGFPNVMFDRKAPSKPSPVPGFARTLISYSERVRQLATIDGPEPTVSLGDARSTGLADESVDAIVSHPPYIGSVPYAEYGLISLKWLGADNRALDGELLGGRRQSKDVIDRFQAMYSDVLIEAHRVLRPGRGMFLMVGDPVVRGVVVDLAETTREKAAAAGFVESASKTRQGINRRANKMAHETLLFFEKPS